MRQTQLLWVVILLLSTAGALLTIFELLPAGAQPWVVGWFLLLCPGMAFVRLLDLDNALVELVVALALSLTLDTMVAWLLVLGEFWQPRLAIVLLAALATIGIVLQVRQIRQGGGTLPRSHIVDGTSSP